MDGAGTVSFSNPRGNVYGKYKHAWMNFAFLSCKSGDDSQCAMEQRSFGNEE